MRGPRRAWSHRDADDGAIAGLEALAFGALIFVAGTLLIVNAWGVIDAKFAVSAAAREATRTFVEAPGGSVADARSQAHDAALRTLVGHGKTGAPHIEIAMAGETPVGGLVRCAPVVATVRYHVPSLFVPFVGTFGALGFTVQGTYTEVVDPFRSGLGGGDGCASASP